MLLSSRYINPPTTRAPYEVRSLSSLDLGHWTSDIGLPVYQLTPQGCLWSTLLYYDPLSRYLVASTMANFFSNLS